MRWTVTVRPRGKKKADRFYIAYEGPRREEAYLVARMAVNTLNAVFGTGTVTVAGVSKIMQIQTTWNVIKGNIVEASSTDAKGVE